MTHTATPRIAALLAAGLLTAAGGAAHADTATSGNGSIGGGNQVVVDGDVPVNVCGNAVAVVGVAGAQCTDGAAVVHDGPSGEPGSPADPVDRRTDDGYDGYDGYGEEIPEENPREDTPDEGGTPGETASPSPEESPAPTEENRGEVPEEEGAPPQERPGAPVTEQPSAPAGDDTELAVTGTDGTGLLWMVAAALATAAAGAGLILLGLRRRARA